MCGGGGVIKGPAKIGGVGICPFRAALPLTHGTKNKPEIQICCTFLIKSPVLVTADSWLLLQVEIQVHNWIKHKPKTSFLDKMEKLNKGEKGRIEW